MRKGFVFLSVLILLSTRTFALKDYSKISPRIHRMIVATIKETQANIYDYNLDGEINCRDYSCVFKVTWDRLYPKEAYRCTLVRNSPPYGNGHLFVNIEDDNSCPIDVEPQAHSPQQPWQAAQECAAIYVYTPMIGSMRKSAAFSFYDSISERSKSA